MGRFLLAFFAPTSRKYARYASSERRGITADQRSHDASRRTYSFVIRFIEKSSAEGVDDFEVE
jgi:hypothetical protein